MNKPTDLLGALPVLFSMIYDFHQPDSHADILQRDNGGSPSRTTTKPLSAPERRRSTSISKARKWGGCLQPGAIKSSGSK